MYWGDQVVTWRSAEGESDDTSSHLMQGFVAYEKRLDCNL